MIHNYSYISSLGIKCRNIEGNQKVVCPKCSLDRKKKKDPCLSVDVSAGLIKCFNPGCEWETGLSINRYTKPKREYVRPQPRLQKVSDKVVKYFEGRGISNNTLLRLGITESLEWMPQFEKEVPCICFNYFRGDDLVNIKFRGPNKSFKLAKDAELIFYNLNSIIGEKEVHITEGEIEVLTLHECGIYNVVSVPNGASLSGNAKLEYLDNCWQDFEDKEVIYLWTDNDEPGLALRDELARRLGKERVKLVTYPQGYKDPNEVFNGDTNKGLPRLGKDAILHMKETARDWPLEGVVTMDDIFPTIAGWYEQGYPKGARTGHPEMDKHLTWVPRQLTVVTGIPGHGKDEWTDWVMALLAVNADWAWGLCDFEESPAETTTKLMEKITGKSFAFRKDSLHRMTPDDVERAIGIIDEKFNFINTEEIETDLDSILEKAAELVRKRGIRGFRLNPWNWVESSRPKELSETEYISQSLSKVVRFARRYDCHVIILAHTTKISKDKVTHKYDVPTLYNINGSANWFNKTHNGITIYRHYDTGMVEIHYQKIKQSWLGEIGCIQLFYDTFTRQYKSVPV